MGTIFRLEIRQILGGRRKWVILAFLTLPVFLTVLIRAGFNWEMPDSEDLREFDVNPFFLAPYFLYSVVVAGLLALLNGSLFVSTEVSGRTLTYLFTRPIPKWKVLVAKFAAAVAATTPPTLLSLTATFTVLEFYGGFRGYAITVFTTVLAIAAYNAVFAVWGAIIPRRAMVVCLAYWFLMEVVLSFVPAVINQLSMAFHIRSIALILAEIPIPEDLVRVIGAPSLVGSLAALTALIVGTLGIACLIFLRREYPMTEEV